MKTARTIPKTNDISQFKYCIKKGTLKDGTLIEVFTRDIEGNPFEKGFL